MADGDKDSSKNESVADDEYKYGFHESVDEFAEKAAKSWFLSEYGEPTGDSTRTQAREWLRSSSGTVYQSHLVLAGEIAEVELSGPAEVRRSTSPRTPALTQRIEEIVILTEQIFHHPDAAMWLEARMPGRLDNLTPLEAMKTVSGWDEVKGILLALCSQVDRPSAW